LAQLIYKTARISLCKLFNRIFGVSKLYFLFHRLFLISPLVFSFPLRLLFLSAFQKAKSFKISYNKTCFFAKFHWSAFTYHLPCAPTDFIFDFLSIILKSSNRLVAAFLIYITNFSSSFLNVSLISKNLSINKG